MRSFLTLCVAAIAAVAMVGIAAADTTSASGAAATPTIVTPDSLTWSPVKGIDGATMAVVAGDPNKSGLYTVRMKLTDGTKVPIHWHNDAERVTVLSGTLMFAAGHSFDASSMKTLGPGSFVYIPAGVHHYAMAKGDTVLQVTGNGPMTFNLMK